VDDALPGCLGGAGRQVGLQDRAGRLLDLEEQRIAVVPPLEEDHEGPRADAADTDDLAGHIDDAEPLHEQTPLGAERLDVGPELGLHELARRVP
jgi:hypothetical protein